MWKMGDDEKKVRAMDEDFIDDEIRVQKAIWRILCGFLVGVRDPFSTICDGYHLIERFCSLSSSYPI